MITFGTDIHGSQMMHHYVFLLPFCGFKKDISTKIGWITMTFGTDKMNSNNALSGAIIRSQFERINKSTKNLKFPVATLT